MTWTCCRCNFDNQNGHYCGGQLPGGGQIAYSVACGHSRCLMCVERIGRSAPLYSQAQYQGYHQPFPQNDAYQHPFPPPRDHSQNRHFLTSSADYQWHQFDVARERLGNPSSGHHHSANPPPQPDQPPPLPSPTQQQESPLQAYLTSRLTTQFHKPCVMTIGDYDKMMSGPPPYTPPVGYLADYAILNSSPSPSPSDPQRPRKRDKKREEMMLREEKASFGFAQRVWQKHCETLRAGQDQTPEEYDNIQQNQPENEIKMELNEEDFSHLQQLSRRRRDGREAKQSGRSKKAKNKGKDRQPGPVMEPPRISRKDKGKEREQGQDYFTETVQGGQTWSFGGLNQDGMMDVNDEGDLNSTTQRVDYQATVEEIEKEEL